MKASTYNQDNFEEDFGEEQLPSSNAIADLSAYEKHLSLKRLLIFLSIVLFLIAWNRGVALLYAMDALIVSTIMITWIIPKYNIRNIYINLSLPETASEGDVIPLIIKTQKTGFFSRFMIECWVDLPFVSSDEASMVLLDKINQRESHQIDLPCNLRGHFTVKELKLQTGFPLGLATTTRYVALNEASSILIYPTPIDLSQFEVAKDKSQSAMQQDSNPKAGGNDEYIGIREYRQGDSPRHIHWPTSAKRGELVVREYQQNSTTHLNIILDLNPSANFGKGKHSTLEYSIRITATLIKYSLENNFSFSVFGMGKEPFEINKRNSSLNSALEALAWVQANGEYSYAQTIRQYLSENRRGGTLVLFDNGNDNITSLLPEFQAQQLYPLIYKFDRHSFMTEADQVINQSSVESLPTKNENNVMTNWNISRGNDLRALFL